MRDFKTKLLLFLKLTAILIRTFILCFRSQDKITTFNLLFSDDPAKSSYKELPPVPPAHLAARVVALL